MTWFVEVLEARDDEGKGTGNFHLCAKNLGSDACMSGCLHDHKTAYAAECCDEALISIGAVTGVPHIPGILPDVSDPA